MILVTGGAGFIGANFVLDWIEAVGESVVTLDKLTYAGNPRNLAVLDSDRRHQLVVGDIGDTDCVESLLSTHRPRAVLNFAAESHVDRSIHGPAAFVETNLLATFRLLETVMRYWRDLPGDERAAFRFLHVSTDEVYGSLAPEDPAFSERTPYAPNSPYSATKAGSDHLVRAYHHTYGLPVLTTNCSNNYGPYQFPEKLIPLIIHNALNAQPLPIYGDGLNVRDWLYVGDHCAALRRVLAAGEPGRVYNIGGNQEMTNIAIVRQICQRLDALRPDPAGAHERLIRFVDDRPGHDRRYAIDARRISSELGWQPAETFASGIERTIDWYLTHTDWVQEVVSGDYRQWVQAQYGTRA